MSGYRSRDLGGWVGGGGGGQSVSAQLCACNVLLVYIQHTHREHGGGGAVVG